MMKTYTSPNVEFLPVLPEDILTLSGTDAEAFENGNIVFGLPDSFWD